MEQNSCVNQNLVRTPVARILNGHLRAQIIICVHNLVTIS